MKSVSALWHQENANLYNMICSYLAKSTPGKLNALQFERGQIIYSYAEKATHVYFILSGYVRIGHYLEDGMMITNAMLTRGEMFGELALAGEETRSEFALSIEDSTIFVVSVSEMGALMSSDSGLSSQVLKLMGLRLMILEWRFRLLKFKDARTRVVEFIRDAAWRGKKVGCETLIQFNLNHRDIASMVGTSRQTVNTVLNELKKKNLIKFNRKSILVRNIETLM